MFMQRLFSLVLRPLCRRLAALAAGVALVLASAVSLPAAVINDGDLIIGDVTSARLIRVDFDAGLAEVITSGGHLTGTSGVRVHRPTGSIYTANQINQGGPGLHGRIIRVDVLDGPVTQTIVADGRGSDGEFGGVDGSLRFPRYLSFEASGTMVVAERSLNFGTGVTPRNGIVRFDPSNTDFDTNTSDVRVGTFGDPLAVLASPQGRLFLGDRIGDTLYTVSADGSSQTVLNTLIANGVSAVSGLTPGTIDVDGRITTLFVSEIGANRVSRIDFVYSGDDIIGGTRTQISNGVVGNLMNQPTDVVYDELADVLYAVAAENKGVYRISDPFGPAPTTVYLDLIGAAGGAITSSNFAPNGLDVFFFQPPEPPAPIIPEPSSLLLLAAGCLALAWRRPRRG